MLNQPQSTIRDIELADYEDRNSFSWDDSIIRGRLASSIKAALRNYLNQQIAATTVDVVAHSMGGLVTRSFMAQSSDNAALIHRFITVGTPGLGSPLAEKLIQYKDNGPKSGTYYARVCFWWGIGCTLGAGFDYKGRNVTNGGAASLKPSSIGASAGHGGVSALAISGAAPANTKTEAVFNDILSAYSSAPTPETVDGLLGAKHDTVVPGDSQVAGSSENKEIGGIIHAQGDADDNTPTETGSGDVYQQVYSWLTVATGSATVPEFIPTESYQAATAFAEPISSIDFTKLQEVSATAFSISPSDGSTLTPGASASVRFSSFSKTISRVFCAPSAPLQFADLQASPFVYSFVPADFSDIRIYVVVLFTDNTFARAAITYKSQVSGSPSLFSSRDSRVVLAAPASTAKMYMTARYGNNVVDVTRNSTYSLESNTVAVASVSAAGIVTANAKGVDSLRFTHAGISFSIPLLVGDCDYRLTTGTNFLLPAGGDVAVNLATANDCRWSITSDSTWLTSTTASTGLGPATLHFQGASSSSFSSRSAILRVGESVLTVSQAALGCTYRVSGAPLSVSASGATVSISVSTSSGCLWSVASDSAWLILSSTGGLIGSAALTLQAAANGGPARTGTLLIAGQTFAVTQGASSGRSAPAFAAAGVLNAASYRGGAVAPGEVVTIFGTGLGPDTLVQLTIINNIVQTQLAGVIVLFDGVRAPIVYASAKQTSVVVPYSVDGRAQTTVQVQYAGLSSAPVTLPVTSSSPGMFTSNATGSGQGAILNQDNSFNSSFNSAAKGSVVILYLTGEGQTSPSGVDGRLAVDSTLPKPSLPVGVTIGGQVAEVLYAGAAPTYLAGLMQVNVRVPAAVASGAQPVLVTVGSATSQTATTVAVR